MNNNIALVDIRAFVTIAESGSFTKAAERLLVSRAHLSRQLNQLEYQLGVQLLVRTTRSQRLTEAGEDFYERCKNALGHIDQAVSDIKNESEQLKGPIALNCVGGQIGEEIVTGIVADFLKHYPEIEIDLDFSSQRVDLVGDGFDLVIRMGKLDDSRFIARKLMDLEVSTLASPEYLKTRAKPSSPDELLDHNCLTGSVKKWSFIKDGEEGIHKEVMVKGNMTCKNGRSMIKAALAGVGIARVPSFYCRKEIEAGALESVMIGWHVASTPIYALYHAKKYQSKRLKVFIDYLVSEFSKRVGA